MSITVASFYKFVDIDDCPALAELLSAAARKHDISGTILIAGEGVNGTIAGQPDAVSAFVAGLRAMRQFNDLAVKLSTASAPPFQRMKIKIKPEIVTLGVAARACETTGTRVRPEDWNALISDPDVVLVDTRNHYEVAIGSFPGAIDPHTNSFQDFPAFVDAQLADLKNRRIAMFCTGGIRCEKASALLLEAGFQNVFQLDGGILKYLEDIPQSESLWQGECFVFDGRVALKHGVVEGEHVLCAHCGAPFHQPTAAPSDVEPVPFCAGCCNLNAGADRRAS